MPAACARDLPIGRIRCLMTRSAAQRGRAVTIHAAHDELHVGHADVLLERERGARMAIGASRMLHHAGDAVEQTGVGRRRPLGP
jgi:hypothetical protein